MRRTIAVAKFLFSFYFQRTFRLKFGQTNLSSLKRNTLNQEVNQRRGHYGSDRSHRTERDTPAPVKKEPTIAVKPAKPTTFYRSLPTASGLKLDQKAVQTLVEMGFDKQNATQALQEADNDIHAGL